MFCPTSTAWGGSAARTCCIASSRGTPCALRTSSVMPVRGVRYECTFFPSGGFTYTFSRHRSNWSTNAICATSLALCSFPVATHSTSMEKYVAT